MTCGNSQICRAPHCGMPPFSPARDLKKRSHLELIKRITSCGHHFYAVATALKERGLGAYLILLLGSIFALLLIGLIR